jgi:hypothetical protein
VTAVLTCDSDFLIYDAVDAVIHTDAVKHLFREEVAAVSKDIMVWKKGAAAHAVLAKVRAKKYGSGNFTTLPNTAMYDVAAILGNDVSKKVRDVLKAKEESSGRGRSPWSVIASLLERDKTTYREPCDGGWRRGKRITGKCTRPRATRTWYSGHGHPSRHHRSWLLRIRRSSLGWIIGRRGQGRVSCATGPPPGSGLRRFGASAKTRTKSCERCAAK